MLPLDADPEEAGLIAEAWERGELSWKLRPYQFTTYEIIWSLIETLRAAMPTPTEFRVGTVVASRKIGKSFLESLIAMEFCIRNPGEIVRIGAPTAVEAREIFLPEFEKILSDCPKHLRPRPVGVDGHWRFLNKSTIVLKGVDLKPDRLRGPSSGLNFVDEASYIKRLRYLVESVLYPMTVNTRGPTILCSTLNQSPNSEFNEYFDRCEGLGQAAIVDVYSAGFTPAQIEAERNAVNQDTWEIEYECKRKRSANMTVVPEWTAERKAALIEAAPLAAETPSQPELAYWRRLVSIDFGTVDNTVVLSGYLDFARTTLWITGEGILRGAEVTAGNIAGVVERLEACDAAERPMHQTCKVTRTGDHNIEMLQTLQIDHKLPFQIVKKLGLETMVNLFRAWVSKRQVRIHPRCVNLLACLDKGAWNERAATRKDGPRERVLARSTLVDANKVPLGHFDALMTAVYMVLTADTVKGHNPLPETFVTAAQTAVHGPYRREVYGQHRHGDSVAKGVPRGQTSGVPWLPKSARRR